MNSLILFKINNFIKNRLIEILGIFLVCISLFLLASIFSYSPSDPNFIYSPENVEIKNFLINTNISENGTRVLGISAAYKRSIIEVAS